jgi:hypothetical protein
VAAEIALQDATIGSTVENCAPCFQLSHAGRRLFGVQFSHSPTVHVLAAAHGIGKVNAPGIAIIDVGKSGCDAAFRHHRMSLPEQRFRDDRYFDARRGGFGGSAQTGAARSDYQDVVLVGQVLGHYKILQSLQTPMEHRRMYKSANPTEKRLHQANSMWRRFKQLTHS